MLTRSAMTPNGFCFTGDFDKGALDEIVLASIDIFEKVGCRITHPVWLTGMPASWRGSCVTLPVEIAYRVWSNENGSRFNSGNGSERVDGKNGSKWARIADTLLSQCAETKESKRARTCSDLSAAHPK